MKKTICFFAFLLFLLLHISSENTRASQLNKLDVNLDTCTLSERLVSFDRIMHGKFDRKDRNRIKEFLNKLNSQLSYILGAQPSEIDSGLPTAVWKDSAGNTVLSTGVSFSGDYSWVSLYIGTGMTRMIPNIKPNSTPEEIEAIFSAKHEIKNKINVNDGEQFDYDLLLCGKHKVEINSVPTEKGLKKRKDPSYFFPITITIPLKNSIVSSKANTSSAIITNKKFGVGDPIYVLFQNGRKCKATILIPGKEQSKIEYNEHCETGFISHKSKGESEWAPNEAISQR